LALDRAAWFQFAAT